MTDPKLIQRRSDEIYDNQMKKLATNADRMFAVLMVLQWICAIVFALWLAPKIWTGEQSQVHVHVYAAIFLGALLTSLPVFFAIKKPGEPVTRHTIAAAQALYSALLIHLTGGRIETHFHVFGSLAILAIYRDSRVLLTASAVVAADHLLRGHFWPQSVYGTLTATPWRALEHAAWVVFEDAFLFYSNTINLRGMRLVADSRAKLEVHLNSVEEVVEKRTAELRQSQQIILSQQQNIVASAKHSALGEMAGQIAHEINTPLGAIMLTAQGLKKNVLANSAAPQDTVAKMDFILQVTNKLARIIGSMRKLAGHGGHETIREVPIRELVEDILLLCEGRFKKDSIDFQSTFNLKDGARVQCRANEISQILVNLLNNAHYAALGQKERWVRLVIEEADGFLLFKVIDSGEGVKPENISKLFLPQFTTKSLDAGTGFGLSICKKLADQHNGDVYLDTRESATTFVLKIPFEQTEALARVANG